MKKIACLFALVIILVSCAKKATMTESNAKPDASFTNTRWKLIKLPDVEIPAMDDAFIRFYEGKSSGSSGCNRFSGSFTEEGKKLKLGPQAGTRMMCEPAIMQVENAFLKALGETDQYSVSGDHMLLKKGDMILAEFEALYL